MTPSDFITIRKSLGLSQTAMGHALGGYALRTVQSWEGGERDFPPAVAVLMGMWRG